MVTNGIPCGGSGLPGDRASASSTAGGGGLIANGSFPDGMSEAGSSSIRVPNLLPMGLPFLQSLCPEPPFYPGHPGPGFDLKENMEAWRSIPAFASMYGGYDDAILAGYPMLRNGYGMDLNGSRRKNATRETTSTLKAWLSDHRKNPYPTKAEKIMLAIITQMTLTQVSTWFANARRRLKKENKMTWSPRNRCDDDDDDDCKEGDSSADSRDVQSSPLRYVNHHRSSSLHSNGNYQTEPESDVNIDDDSSSDNLIDKKRFKRNESPLSDSGVTVSATSGLNDHHPLHPAHLNASPLSDSRLPGLNDHHSHHHPLHHVPQSSHKSDYSGLQYHDAAPSSGNHNQFASPKLIPPAPNPVINHNPVENLDQMNKQNHSKGNKMTWSPKNRRDDDGMEVVFNPPTNSQDVDCSAGQQQPAPPSNSNKDNTEPDSVVNIDGGESSSGNLIGEKRFERNESPRSDSGLSGTSATSSLHDDVPPSSNQCGHSGPQYPDAASSSGANQCAPSNLIPAAPIPVINHNPVENANQINNQNPCENASPKAPSSHKIWHIIDTAL